ncbi:hypothetical protein [Parerythrobacter lacustris]|nr:hypothetical protein [Parerythrobacter lacustris]
MHPPSDSPVEMILRDELAHGDGVLQSLAPILGHLVATAGNPLFNDQVVASIRGRAADVARQLLREQAAVAGLGDPDGFADAGVVELADALMNQQGFLVHCHALTIEAQTAEALRSRSGIDPVVSPMLQSLIASKSPEIAGGAMAILAAQARFFQQHARMELPLRELPGAIFEQVLHTWRNFAGSDASTITAQAEGTLRSTFDEGMSRIGLLNRMISALGKDARPALAVSNGGVSLFTSALAHISDQARDTIVVATSEQLVGRLALSLRAAGLDASVVAEQFAYFHPDIDLPEGFEALRQDRAQELLQHRKAGDAD